MFNSLANWIDDRTGCRSFLNQILDLPIPGGARWRYALGASLAAAFLIELFTGLLLMTTYSPSATTAWGSVYYISYQMDLGWFIRGLHRFGAFAMVILAGCHLVLAVVTGVYRAPREIQWWIILGLTLLTLILGVTGNILPWDQRGYWAAVVEMNIAGSAPGIGPIIKKLVVGGAEFGNQTVTRIYGLHAVVLPGLYLAGLAAYAGLILKHGLKRPRSAHADAPFWPKQAFLNVVAGLILLGVLVAIVVARHGYSLDAPADSASEDYPARPEWYFLSLNRLLHRFAGEKEIIGTMIIPGAIGAVLFLLPLMDRLLPRRFVHFLACSFLFALVGGAGFLTYEAWDNDARSDEFQTARSRADEEGARARLLAEHQGIPPEGSPYLLSRDPLTRGAAIFEKKCQGCHAFGGKVAEEQSAPDLEDFGSYRWIRGLLEKPDADACFGKVPQCDGMLTWKESSRLTPQQLDDVAGFVSSFASISPDLTPAEWLDDPRVKSHPGYRPYQKECAECHTMGDPSEKDSKLQPAPDLFAWGSHRWTARMIRRPGSPNLYGYLEEEQKMPASEGQLTDADLETLVRYLKGDYFRSPATTDRGKPVQVR